MEATSTTTSPTPSSGLRPTFLTVLCVLTFIGSGWGVIKAVQSYFTADSMAAIATEAIEEAEDKMDGAEAPSFLKNIIGSVGAKMTPENIRKSSIFSLIGNLLTLTGAIMMWNLRRVGFYLYIGGIVVLMLSPFIVMGGGMLAGVSAISEGVIGLVFIILYGLNLKHMTK